MIYLLFGLLGAGAFYLSAKKSPMIGTGQTVHDPITNLTFVLKTMSVPGQTITRNSFYDARTPNGEAILTFSQAPDGTRKLLEVLRNDPGNDLVVAARRASGL
jgi:hypothetical protein